MRTTRHLFALATLLLLAGTAVRAGELAIGAAMPLTDVPMMNVDDQTVTLDQIKGEKGTVVVFWCNHCPWVVNWRDRFVKLADDYTPKGFGFIAINSNDPKTVAGDSLEAMKTFAKEHHYKFPYTVDAGSKLAVAYGATKTPHVYVFNAEQKLVYVGAIDDNGNSAEKVTKTYLRDALEALLAGKPVATTQSKALGCTIKFYN
jgi:peroxiredoxin